MKSVEAPAQVSNGFHHLRAAECSNHPGALFSAPSHLQGPAAVSSPSGQTVTDVCISVPDFCWLVPLPFNSTQPASASPRVGLAVPCGCWQGAAPLLRSWDGTCPACTGCCLTPLPPAWEPDPSGRQCPCSAFVKPSGAGVSLSVLAVQQIPSFGAAQTCFWAEEGSKAKVVGPELGVRIWPRAEERGVILFALNRVSDCPPRCCVLG